MPEPDQLDQPSCSPAEHSHLADVAVAAPDDAVERSARLFRALGDSSRLRLLSRLLSGELCVGDLAQLEQESLSTISQRLRVLRAENVVVRKRRGKHINYALADGHIVELVSNALAHAKEPSKASQEIQTSESSNN